VQAVINISSHYSHLWNLWESYSYIYIRYIYT